MMKTWKRAGIAAGLSLSLILAACGAEEDEEDTTEGEIPEDTEENGADEGSDEEAAGNIGEEVDYTITGIDAGAGVMAAAEQAIEDYELEDWSVQPSSSAAMTSALDDAIANEEPIIVTGWNPHWKFAVHDLKYLEDPEGSFGESEDIHTLVRNDLEADMPEAYQVLDNFNWEGEDMEEVMLEVNEGTEPEEAARTWVDENEDMVSEWTEGVEEVDGEQITLAFVAWDSEIASTNVVATVLSDLGYEVKTNSMEAPIMFGAVAEGEADAMVAAWLPGTHEQYYNDYEGEFEDLGANLEGAKIGLVVPEYVEADSIEDLQ
ncbi:glycine betaine ABC transporter substrate-binding protein [Alteribacillus bidgolensis]|uniref:Glycine betaine/proline transport system substrate-binding protein n=1 Tax=Alteribacillus bidgolensis TaxID=930129 RepID=A0A1G8HMX2_9BACI|nr:glycine betaine ABC transporter substrate-binding protein [Alteribacillus bidgolensis]SDI07780.1 glycine betaine/proline transport system substrate-binding protein [Alteribacillus bidgolensis]